MVFACITGDLIVADNLWVLLHHAGPLTAHVSFHLDLEEVL